MRKVVNEEMVAAAVEHCKRENKNPSRGRVMGLLAQNEFGGCAGDPARVGAMIREYLAAKGGAELTLAPASEVSGQPLPPQIEAALVKTAQRMNESMDSLADALSAELASIKAELRANYDQASEQMRRDADRTVTAAQSDEQDALDALDDALSQKSALEVRVEVLQAEHSAALAVAAERGEQLLRLEAELKLIRSETKTENGRLTAERDEARMDAREAVKSAYDKETVITKIEAKLDSLQFELDDSNKNAGLFMVLADERAAQIKQLESFLAEALRDIRKPAQVSVDTPEVAFSNQSQIIACTEAIKHPEGDQVRSGKGEVKGAKPTKSAVKSQPASTGDDQELCGVPA